MRGTRPRWLHAASHLFRWSARLTPRPFRERFGWESEDAFHQLVEDAFAREGSRAAIRTAAAACGDIARAGVSERASGWHSRMVAGVRGDVVQSVRIYRREPLLGLSIAAILALVAGPTAAVLGVLYAIVLAPLPYPAADRLVAIAAQGSGGAFYYLRAAAVSDLRAVDAFATVGGYFPIAYRLATDGGPERIQGAYATAGLLSDLGVPFAAGRDLRRGDTDAVVVTSGFAVARFGSAAAAVDRLLPLGNKPVRIVGVIAYRPPLPMFIAPADVFTPHVNADAATPPRRMSQAIVIARLKPDVAHGAADAQLKTVAADTQKRFGEPEMRLGLVTLRSAVSGTLRTPMLLLATAAAVVFLIGISSLASLVLARAAARSTDIAVRTSLGASRWRVVRSWILDGAALALPGGAAGAWLGVAVLRYLRAQLPTQLGLLPADVTVPMMAGLAGLTTLSVGLFAVAPIAAGLLKASSTSFLRVTHQVAGTRGLRSQSILIAGQVAVSIVLVASTLWLSASLWRVLSRPIGFDPDNLVVMSVRSAQPSPVQLDIARRMIDGLGGIAAGHSEGVAGTSSLPGINHGGYSPARIRLDQPLLPESERPVIAMASVSTDYFRVVGIGVIEGRTFLQSDEAAPGETIVVSRSFAQRFFPEGALGKTVSFSKDERREIVGIVEDVHAGRLTQASSPQCYTPLTDMKLTTANSFVVRTSNPIETIRTRASSIVRELDPNAQLTIMTAADAIALPLLLQTLSNRLIAALAAIALLLAVVNVYALSAFAVVQRRREIGIRVALGATAADAIRLVMRRGLLWIGAGLVAGLGVALFVAAPIVQAQLYATTARDPILLAAACGLVAAIAVRAGWLPARRAAAIDPAITLRAE